MFEPLLFPYDSGFNRREWMCFGLKAIQNVLRAEWSPPPPDLAWSQICLCRLLTNAYGHCQPNDAHRIWHDTTNRCGTRLPQTPSVTVWWTVCCFVCKMCDWYGQGFEKSLRTFYSKTMKKVYSQSHCRILMRFHSLKFISIECPLKNVLLMKCFSEINVM